MIGKEILTQEKILLHKGLDRNVYAIEYKSNKYVLKEILPCYINELLFYRDIGKYLDCCPEIYYVDTDNCIVVMEFLEPCGLWDKSMFGLALDVIARFHVQFYNSKDLPEWIPRLDEQMEKAIQSYRDSIINADTIVLQYKDTLDYGVELLKDLFPKVLELPHTLVHGDLGYQNTGIAKGKMKIFDWNNIKIAIPEYEICYPLEYLFRKCGDQLISYGLTKDYIISYYVNSMNKMGISLDKEKFTENCKIMYLYKCLLEFIPGYINYNWIDALHQKVPYVCKLINEFKETI